MEIVEINNCNFGSTGNIMLQIADAARLRNHIIFTSVPDSRDNQKKQIDNQLVIGNRLSRNLHLKLAQITGKNGCFSRVATRKYLNALNQLHPDIVHLHNLHNCYINLPMLFSYIKKNNIRVIWTLHDCWSFTGQCPYFTIVKCNKWKTGCDDCPQYRNYPESYVDRTKTMYKLKRKWFTNVKDMTIVTPSEWLASLVKQSYLKDYPVKVINNGINLNIFKPTQSDFREIHGLTGKYVVLGVALGWGNRKGFDVFIDLSKRLESEKYRIVLVGTDAKTDKKLPENIISIHRTQNQTELAEIYSAADVFVNPTREENFPTVNMESIACGTPIVTFQTGGSPEMLDDSCGSVVPCNDNDALCREIVRVSETKPFSEEACLKRAQDFDMNDKFSKYITLYEEMIGEKNVY